MSSFGPMGAFGQRVEYQSQDQELTVARFFNSVYSWMAVGLAITAIVSYAMFVYGAGLLNTGTLIVCIIAQIGLVFAITGAINRINAVTATVLFVLYAALMGVTMSVLFFVYKQGSIATVFVETAGMFAATSIYGYVTKRDLSRLGSILFMALIGLLIASLVNMFVASSAMFWLISYAGVLIFVGLTAFDTQRLKVFAIQNVNNPGLANRMAIVGSLMLYLDFINLFMFLLRIMGNRRQ